MEQILQLKQMRDAALERLQINPDFKLVNSLDQLITDLEEVLIATDEVSTESASADEQPTDDPVVVNAASDSFGSTDDEIEATGEEASEDGIKDIPAFLDGADSDEALDRDNLDSLKATGEDDAIAKIAENDPNEAQAAIDALEAELTSSMNDDTSIGGSLN